MAERKRLNIELETDVAKLLDNRVAESGGGYGTATKVSNELLRDALTSGSGIIVAFDETSQRQVDTFAENILANALSIHLAGYNLIPKLLRYREEIERKLAQGTPLEITTCDPDLTPKHPTYEYLKSVFGNDARVEEVLDDSRQTADYYRQLRAQHVSGLRDNKFHYLYGSFTAIPMRYGFLIAETGAGGGMIIEHYTPAAAENGGIFTLMDSKRNNWLYHSFDQAHNSLKLRGLEEIPLGV